MSEEQIKILEYINKGYSVNQIAKALNLTNRQLFSRLLTLRDKGFEWSRKYYSDGNISYVNLCNTDSILGYQTSITRRIITKPTEEELKLIAISDLHIGSSKQRLDLLDEIYNYCVKNGIHIIFNCGDLIDGTFNRFPQKIVNPYDQVEFLIKKYPYDKNILNFCVGGDHDLSVLKNCGQDVLRWINNARHDLIVPSFGNAFVRVKDDLILLNHYTESARKIHEFSKQSLNFIGHTHRIMNTYYDLNGILNITVPSLADIGETLPTMIEITMKFKNNVISEVQIKPMQFGISSINTICEIVLPINKKTSLHYKDSNVLNYDFSKPILEQQDEVVSDNGKQKVLSS